MTLDPFVFLSAETCKPEQTAPEKARSDYSCPGRLKEHIPVWC